MTKQECIDSGCKAWDECQGKLDCKNDEDVDEDNHIDSQAYKMYTEFPDIL